MKTKKNTKKRRFAALGTFFEILRESLWSLVKLNLLFLLTCVPVITLGPALAALSGCMIKLAQGDLLEQPCRFYLRIFRRCLKQAFLWGIATLVSVGILGNALFYYGSRISESVIYIPITSLTLVALLFLCGILLHLYSLLAEGVTDNLIQKSALHAAQHMGQTLAAILVSIIMLGLQLWFFPASAPIPLLIGIVLPALVCGLAYKGKEHL